MVAVDFCGRRERIAGGNAQLLLTEIENESGEQYRLDYTPGGLIRQETGFDGQRTAYAYDLNGHCWRKPSSALTVRS